MKNLDMEKLVKAGVAGVGAFAVVTLLGLDPAMSAGASAMIAVAVRDVL